MKQTARIISIHAADTSGVCSMLYELGGMVVVHDASGWRIAHSRSRTPNGTRSSVSSVPITTIAPAPPPPKRTGSRRPVAR